MSQRRGKMHTESFTDVDVTYYNATGYLVIKNKEGKQLATCYVHDWD